MQTKPVAGSLSIHGLHIHLVSVTVCIFICICYDCVSYRAAHVCCLLLLLANVLLGAVPAGSSRRCLIANCNPRCQPSRSVPLIASDTAAQRHRLRIRVLALGSEPVFQFSVFTLMSSRSGSGSWQKVAQRRE